MFNRVSPTLHVRDVSRTASFFEDCLGFDCLLRPELAALTGSGYAVVRRDQVTIHLLQAPDAAGTGVYYISVGDAKQLYVDLITRRVRVLRPLAESRYGTLEFSIADPDGNRIHFGQPFVARQSDGRALA